MFGKKKLCEYILRKYCYHDLDMRRDQLDITKIPEGEVFKSTTVGICMEELGLIKNPSIKDYISNRGGTAFTSFDENGEPVVISFREILDSMKE